MQTYTSQLSFINSAQMHTLHAKLSRLWTHLIFNFRETSFHRPNFLIYRFSTYLSEAWIFAPFPRTLSISAVIC